MVSTSDLQRWQQAITGITAAQNDLSPNEQSAFSALVELYNNGNFEASESIANIKALKYSTTKNRLLKKVHLTNFVTLCEKYFKAQAVVPSVPAPVASSQPVISPPFEPPNVQPPKEVPVPPPTLPPPPQQSYHTVQKTGSSRKGNNSVVIIIGLVIIFMLGYISVKETDWFKNFVSCGDVTTSNEVQLELEIAKLINQIGEQQTTIDSKVNLIVSLKNQVDEKQAIIDSMANLIESLQKTSKTQQNVIRATVTEKTEDIKRLTSTVQKAQRLLVSDILTTGLSNRNAVTERVRMIDKLKTCFIIRENQVAAAGERVFYLVIIKPDKSVLTNRTNDTFPTQERGEMVYTDRRSLDYENKDIEICIFSDNGGRLTAGVYEVKLYCDGYLVGSSVFTLN